MTPLASGGLGGAGLALLQTALKAGGGGGAGGGMGGGLGAVLGGAGMMAGPFGAGAPGLLSSVFDPQNPGGKNGLLAKLRAMGQPTAGAPMSLAPPPMTAAPVGPMPLPNVGANALTGVW